MTQVMIDITKLSLQEATHLFGHVVGLKTKRNKTYAVIAQVEKWPECT